MSDIRDKVVEAMAQAMFSFEDETEWSALHPSAQDDFRNIAEAALDALLDVLGEFVKAADIGAKNAGLSPLVAHGLLAVLRAGKGSE